MLVDRPRLSFEISPDSHKRSATKFFSSLYFHSSFSSSSSCASSPNTTLIVAAGITVDLGATGLDATGSLSATTL